MVPLVPFLYQAENMVFQKNCPEKTTVHKSTSLCNFALFLLLSIHCTRLFHICKALRVHTTHLTHASQSHFCKRLFKFLHPGFNSNLGPILHFPRVGTFLTKVLVPFLVSLAALFAAPYLGEALLAPVKGKVNIELKSQQGEEYLPVNLGHQLEAPVTPGTSQFVIGGHNCK